MKILKIVRLGVVQAAHRYTNSDGDAIRVEEDGLLVYTEEGIFIMPCSTLEKAFTTVQVNEYDSRDDEALGFFRRWSSNGQT
jgi:hypothetical protein